MNYDTALEMVDEDLTRIKHWRATATKNRSYWDEYTSCIDYYKGFFSTHTDEEYRKARSHIVRRINNIRTVVKLNNDTTA